MSTFQYACEQCGDDVTLGRAEFTARKGVVRCPACLEKTARVTTARKLRTIQATRIAAPCCVECGSQQSPRRHFRLAARNLEADVRLLCPPCGRKLAFQPVTYDRLSANAHGRSAA